MTKHSIFNLILCKSIYLVYNLMRATVKSFQAIFTKRDFGNSDALVLLYFWPIGRL